MNLLKAAQDAVLVEIGSFLAGVEFDDGVEFRHVNGAAPLNSGFSGDDRAEEPLELLNVGAHLETASLGSTNQTNSHCECSLRGIFRPVAVSLKHRTVP